MTTFLFRTLCIFITSFTIAACSSCNNKNQTAQTNTPTSGGVQSGIQTPNATSASVKANDATNGKSGMEKFITKEAKDPIAFDVRGDKLESITNDTEQGISFGPPRTYQAIPYSTLPMNDISRKFTEYSSPEITISPLHSYSNGKNSLVVSLVKFSTAQTLEQYIEKYEALNKQRFTPATITTTSFKNREIPMTQFFIQESESGIFRIVFPATKKNQLLQFDYTIRRNSIQADMERIEPSIGSIVRLIAAANP